MKIGIIGLGKMGHAIAYRLVKEGHQVIGFDAHATTQQTNQELGITIVDSIETVAKQTTIVWLMVPEGTITESVYTSVLEHLPSGAIIIDGGNSYYKDSIRRAAHALKQHVFFLDCGTSGGIRGRDTGFCLMVGGEKKAYETVTPLLKSIASPHGFSHVGPSGAGHYVKMIHNGIEYALLQAYAEGFQVIKEGTFKDANLDLAEITRLWNTSSVIRSFILELSYDVFKDDQQFETISGEIAESGMGLWTSQEAHTHHIPAPTIDDALKIRAWSRETGGNYATKMIALLRNKFGGHNFNIIKNQQKS